MLPSLCQGYYQIKYDMCYFITSNISLLHPPPWLITSLELGDVLFCSYFSICMAWNYRKGK